MAATVCINIAYNLVIRIFMPYDS